MNQYESKRTSFTRSTSKARITSTHAGVWIARASIRALGEIVANVCTGNLVGPRCAHRATSFWYADQFEHSSRVSRLAFWYVVVSTSKSMSIVLTDRTICTGPLAWTRAYSLKETHASRGAKVWTRVATNIYDRAHEKHEHEKPDATSL